MTGEENARTKENMLIIVIEKAISDPPFNSASVLLSGRLLVCAAKETFLCVPVSAGNEKTSGDEMFDDILGVMNGSEQTGRTQRCHFSGIKWDQVFYSHFPPDTTGARFPPSSSFVVTWPLPSSLQHFLENSLKMGSCHKMKQTHN